MKHAYLRICRLLAASGYRERDLADFVHQVVSQGPEAFLSTVNDLRRLDPRSAAYPFLVDTPIDTFLPPPSDATMKIERLLLHDAGMPRAAAIEMLTEELRLRFPSLEIPPESRTGFSNWIRRLSQDIPEKDLLFIATAIRNRVVQDAPTDWRLN